MFNKICLKDGLPSSKRIMSVRDLLSLMVVMTIFIIYVYGACLKGNLQLSGYLRRNQIKGDEEIFDETNHISFLGETTHEKIQQLEKEFSNDNLFINIEGAANQFNSKGNVLPPWIFDYPDYFYKDQEIARQKIHKMDLNSIPPKPAWPKSINPVPIFIASGRDLLPEWLPKKPNLRFVEILQNMRTIRRITLPDLYLTILTDFLGNIQRPDEINFHPRDYRNYLFAPKSQDSPLGIRDPLLIIDALISNLGILWENRERVTWEKIISYKIRGLGIVQAIQDDNQLITLMAYCGGFKALKGNCGHFPLIVGKNDTCPRCHKLICDECDYCSDKCKPLQKGEEESVEDMDSNLVDDVIF